MSDAVDAIVDFPPHTAVSDEITSTLSVAPTFKGKIFDYRQVVVEAATRKPGKKLTFPGIMPRWDNTARKADRAHIFWNASPNAFKIWATLALKTAQELPLGRRFLFVNSWNEWGEGAMLEPDRAHGRSYLEAIRSARGGYVVGPSDTAKFALISNLPISGAEKYLQNFSSEVQMVSQIMAAQRRSSNDAFRQGLPELVTLAAIPPSVTDGMMIFDHVFPEAKDGVVCVRFGQPIAIIGWMIMDTKSRPYSWDRVAYIILTSRDSEALTYHLPITQWRKRDDINEHYQLGLLSDQCYFGFETSVSTDALYPGDYTIHAVQAVGGSVLSVPCYRTIRKIEA